MIFRKVTATKYIGSNGYSLHKVDDNYSFMLNGKPTKWGNNFPSIRSATEFLNSHNYINATTDVIPISKNDLEIACEIYGFTKLNGNSFVDDNAKIFATYDQLGNIIVDLTSDIGTDDAKVQRIESGEDLFHTLDKLNSSEEIFASVIYRGTNFREILAAGKRNPRDITRNLVRVKSSNVWAYGIEIKDNKANVGDVYIQFKGKNGGPTGGLYRYYDVPVTLWRKFLSYPSKGSFVWKYIRNNFLYSKLDGDKRGKLPNAVN